MTNILSERERHIAIVAVAYALAEMELVRVGIIQAKQAGLNNDEIHAIETIVETTVTKQSVQSANQPKHDNKATCCR